MSASLALLLYLSMGCAAGLLSGLLGVGGGLIIVTGLVWLLPYRGFAPEWVMHAALATSLASIVATSLSSGWAHWKRGSVLRPTAASLLPGLLVGSLGGAWLADLVPGTALRAGFTVFCLLAAYRIVRAPHAHALTQPAPRGWRLSVWGVGIGWISAWVGIGGGSLTVPLLLRKGCTPVQAVGTSAACGFFIACAAAAGYVSGGPGQALTPPHTWGYVYWPAALGIAAASVACAPWGVWLAHHWPARRLKQVFAAFLVIMGLSVLVAGMR